MTLTRTLLAIASLPLKAGLMAAFFYTIGGGFLVFPPAQFIGGL